MLSNSRAYRLLKHDGLHTKTLFEGLRALGIATVLSVSSVGLLIVGVSAALNVSSFGEFNIRMTNLCGERFRIDKRESVASFSEVHCSTYCNEFSNNKLVEFYLFFQSDGSYNCNHYFFRY